MRAMSQREVQELKKFLVDLAIETGKNYPALDRRTKCYRNGVWETLLAVQKKILEIESREEER